MICASQDSTNGDRGAATIMIFQTAFASLLFVFSASLANAHRQRHNGYHEDQLLSCLVSQKFKLVTLANSECQIYCLGEFCCGFHKTLVSPRVHGSQAVQPSPCAVAVQVPVSQLYLSSE